MKALQDLDLFVRAAELGSLSAAARALELTPAAASAALKRLEAELGTVLLLRSTRSLRLSEAGERFLAECRPALQALQQAGRELQGGGDARELRGTLRLTMPSDLGRNLLLPWLDAFQQQHPQVDLRLLFSDRNADVFSQPVEAALRYGEPPDSNLVALPLAPDNRRQLCASPDYLARRGTPHSPAELLDHDCLSFMLGDEVHDRWPFVSRADGSTRVQRVRSRNVANDGEVVRRWALAGRGIAYKSRLDIEADLAAGRLVPLCPEWLGAPAPLFLVVADRRQLSPLLRALREFLLARLAALEAAPALALRPRRAARPAAPATPAPAPPPARHRRA